MMGPWKQNSPETSGLSSQAKSINQSSISGHVFTGQIIEEASSLANQLQQAHSRVDIFVMLLQVICKLFNSLG